MIDKEKGLIRYRVVRGVPFSLYLSLVSRLVLGGVFLYDWSSKIFGPGGSLPPYGFMSSVCLRGSSPSRPTRCPRSRCCPGYSCPSVSLSGLRLGPHTG